MCQIEDIPFVVGGDSSQDENDDDNMPKEWQVTVQEKPESWFREGTGPYARNLHGERDDMVIV